MTSPELTVGKKPPRLFYLDFIRALATLIIVLTHFNNPYLADGRYLITNNPFGIYVGSLGVSLFLIISGAALTYTYKRPIDLKKFYWKRFKGIYPMFWVAWILAVVILFTKNQGNSPVSAPIPNFIFTALGIDGLLANFGIPTAYLLGEWFLGFIVLFYVVFPLLLWAVEKYPVWTIAGALLIYTCSFLYFQSHSGIPSAVILTTRLPELLFGMFFTRYVKRIHWSWLIPAAAIILISSILPDQIPEDIAVTFVGISFFLILVFVGRYLTFQPVRKTVELISKYSYPIFLVHHVVIMEMFNSLPWATFGTKHLILMFTAVLIITFALAVLLDRITTHVVSFVTSCFQGRWWRRQLNPNEP